MSGMTKLKRVANIRAGGTPPVDDPSMWDEDGTPWVAIGDMTTSPVVQHTQRTVSDQGIRAKRLPVGEKGTVLLAMYASLGEVGMLGTTATWNQAIVGLDALGDQSDRRFIAYWLRHLKPMMGSLARSTTQDNLNAEQVANLPFPVIGLVEQRRIADFLDDQTTRIDSIINARRGQLALVDDEWRAALDEAFSAYASFTRLGRLAEVQTGITVDAGRHLDDAVRLPYLRVANVQAGRLDLSEVKTVLASPEQAKRHALMAGDVLMTEGGDLDKLGRGTVWHGQIDAMLHQNHVFAVRARPGLILPEFLALFTETSRARDYFEMTGVRSTNLASTSSRKVLDLPTPFGGVDCQQRTVDELGAWKESAARRTTALNESIGLLQELKRSLISAAVSGEFDVTAADGSGVSV